jgi:hypothetical protein
MLVEGIVGENEKKRKRKSRWRKRCKVSAKKLGCGGDGR